MDKKAAFKLILLVLLALFLRLYRLEDLPVGFHGDEASVGYNAYSLLRTGRDQNGKFLPVAIDQFGDFRPAGYHYLTIPFVALFGLTEFAIRFPSAMFGALTIIPLYFLAMQIFKKEKIAILASLFLAISPWHIAIGRATSESIVALFLVLWGVYFLFCKNYLYSFIFFVFSFFFYHATRIFVPLLVLFSLFFEHKDKTLIKFASLIVFFSLLIFFASNGLGRVGQIGIFRAPGDMQILRQQLSEDVGYSPLIARLLHNKATFYITTIAKNYFEHFTPNFLFLEGGEPARYKVPWTGVMYLADIMLILIALLQRDRSLNKLLLWLFLAPLPAAFSFGELPSVQRAVFMLPSLIILCAYGAYRIVNTKIVFATILILIYSYQEIIFLHNYFYHSFTHEPWYRNAGEKELVFEVNRFVENGKRVIMTSQNDNNLIFYLFYLRFDPLKFQQLGSPRDRDNLQFGDFKFTYKHCPLEGSEDDLAMGETGVIYVNRGECRLPKNSELIKDIRRPDNSIAFRILRLKSDNSKDN